MKIIFSFFFKKKLLYNSAIPQLCNKYTTVFFNYKKKLKNLFEHEII